MSDTPRMDEARLGGTPNYADDGVRALLATDIGAGRIARLWKTGCCLERELAAAQERIRELENLLRDYAAAYPFGRLGEQARAVLTAAKEEGWRP